MRKFSLLFYILSLSITTPLFAAEAHIQYEKETDTTALSILRNALVELKQRDGTRRFEALAQHFPLIDATEFSLKTPQEEKSLIKPSPQISDDEWLAFRNTLIYASSENGTVNYTLTDLDGDGKRDLIVTSYNGGTGLWSFTGVLKRINNQFVAINSDQTDDNSMVTGELFSENGRGANQWGEWVRINNQVYALWYNGIYDEDTFYLLRPFDTGSKVANVTIKYKYEYDDFSITPQEEGEALLPALNEHDKKLLVKTLNTEKYYYSHQTEHQAAPTICPIPPGISSQDAEAYSSGIAGSYTTQPIAVIPVWLNGICNIGSLESYFGRGEFMTISSPKDVEILGTYSITGLPHIISINSTWVPKNENLPWLD